MQSAVLSRQVVCPSVYDAFGILSYMFSSMSNAFFQTLISSLSSKQHHDKINDDAADDDDDDDDDDDKTIYKLTTVKLASV